MFPPRSESSAGFAGLVRYLSDCYRADNREQELLDVFAAKVEWRRTVPDVVAFAAAGHGQESRLEIETEGETAAVSRQALLHRSEKSLQLGALFVTGRLDAEGRGRRVCAPLLTAPLVYDEVGGYLRVEIDRWRLNQPLVAAVAAAGEHDVNASGWPTGWPEPPHTPHDLLSLARTWCDLTPGLRCDLDEALTGGTEAEMEADLRRRRRRASGPHLDLCLSWAQMIFLTRRSVDSRGVLSELERLSEQRPSAPLGCLLGVESSAPPSLDAADVAERAVLPVPAILSAAQRRVVRNAENHPLSLVIGPPGTGKSFTIAAIALDALSRGRSVLVASRMNHAVDVVGDKLEDMLGIADVAVRGGRKAYKKELQNRLKRWLAGLLPVPAGEDFEDLRTAVAKSHQASPSSTTPNELFFHDRLQERSLNELDGELEQLEGKLRRRSEDEVRFGRLAAGEPDPRWWRRLRERWMKVKTERRLGTEEPYWQLMRSYRRGQDRRLSAARRLLQARFIDRLFEVLQRDRRSLTRFRDAVRSRTVSRREDLWRQLDTESLLKALPIWLVNLQDVASLLPFEPQMFDLVILDEATQCDIASSLPVLQRAKRAVIVGDPKQLRHLSFLPTSRQESLADRHGLCGEQRTLFDYRDRSILDLVDSRLEQQHTVSFLDEHFRSAPSIIEFSNLAFYDRRLRVMQESPTHDWHRALYLHTVHGKREASGANPVEAEAVIAKTLVLLEQDRSRPETLQRTLGVLSPFRAQVDLLTEGLAAVLPADTFEKHDLRVGTAHAFQGEERDVMLLSLVVDRGSHPSAFRFLERPDVFNVSVTRARSIQHVFTSVEAADLSSTSEGLLARFLRHMALDRSSPSGAAIEDPFAHEIAARLRLEGCRVWSPYPVAGFDVDVVIEKEGRSLGIDLVGYPGELAGSFEIERYRLFNRAGLRLMPMPYSSWLADPGSCLEAILAQLAD